VQDESPFFEADPRFGSRYACLRRHAWLDPSVNAHRLKSLSLDQWMAECERLKERSPSLGSLAALPSEHREKLKGRLSPVGTLVGSQQPVAVYPIKVPRSF